MAGFADLVRQGIQLASTLTSDFQTDVVHETFSSQDQYGNPTHTSTTYRAIVEVKTRLLRMSSGKEVTSTSKITILQGGIAISPKDRFTVPGTEISGVVVIDEGLLDPTDKREFLSEIYLE